MGPDLRGATMIQKIFYSFGKRKRKRTLSKQITGDKLELNSTMWEQGSTLGRLVNNTMGTKRIKNR